MTFGIGTYIFNYMRTAQGSRLETTKERPTMTAYILCIALPTLAAVYGLSKWIVA